MSDAATPPLSGPPPQLLDIPAGTQRHTRQYPHLVAETLATVEITVSDLHPAVEDPSTLLAHCPDCENISDARLTAAADLLSRRLKLPSPEAVRVAAYEDLRAAHRAVGDR